jgi:hypothetical protein
MTAAVENQSTARAEHTFTFGRNTLVVGENYTDMLLQKANNRNVRLAVEDYQTRAAPHGYRTLLASHKREDHEDAIEAAVARWLLRELRKTLTGQGGHGLIMTPLETPAGDALRLYVPEGSYAVVAAHINRTLDDLKTFYAAMQNEMGQRFVVNIGRQPSPEFRSLRLRIEHTLDAYPNVRITEESDGHATNARNALMHDLLKEAGPVITPLYGEAISATLERSLSSAVKKALERYRVIDITNNASASDVLQRALTDALKPPAQMAKLQP